MPRSERKALVPPVVAPAQRLLRGELRSLLVDQPPEFAFFGDPLLEAPVVTAIKQWRFNPAVKNGPAVAVRARQSFTFDDPYTTPQPKQDLPAAQPQPSSMIATAK